MATRYINAEGAAPITGNDAAHGYHSIKDLITAEGALTSASDIRVVYSATPIVEDDYNNYWVGSIQADDPTTFPKFEINGATLNWAPLDSDTTIYHLNFTFKTVMSNYCLAIFSTRSATASNITIDSCILDSTPPGAGKAGSQLLYFRGPGPFTVKNCSINYLPYSAGFGPLCIFDGQTDTSTNLSIFSNNSIYYHASGSQGGSSLIDSRYSRLLAYDNIIAYSQDTLSANALFKVSNFTGTLSVCANNLWYNASTTTIFDPVGINGGNNIANSNPLFTNPGTDLSIPANSPAVGAGTNNAYTPSYDILTTTRTVPYDIGAYELYVAPAYSYFDSSSISDGTNATSHLSLPDIVTAIQSLGSDVYFDSTSEVGMAFVYYTHADGRQQKRVVHDAINHTGLVNWTSNARDGEWQKTKIKVFDLEGAYTVIPRSTIGTGEDCSHSSGQTALNTL